MKYQHPIDRKTPTLPTDPMLPLARSLTAMSQVVWTLLRKVLGVSFRPLLPSLKKLNIDKLMTAFCASPIFEELVLY